MCEYVLVNYGQAAVCRVLMDPNAGDNPETSRNERQVLPLHLSDFLYFNWICMFTSVLYGFIAPCLYLSVVCSLSSLPHPLLSLSLHPPTSLTLSSPFTNPFLNRILRDFAPAMKVADFSGLDAYSR